MDTHAKTFALTHIPLSALAQAIGLPPDVEVIEAYQGPADRVSGSLALVISHPTAFWHLPAGWQLSVVQVEELTGLLIAAAERELNENA